MEFHGVPNKKYNVCMQANPRRRRDCGEMAMWDNAGGETTGKLGE